MRIGFLVLILVVSVGAQAPDTIKHLNKNQVVIGGINIQKLENDVALPTMATSAGTLVISRNASASAIKAISERYKCSSSDAEAILKFAKSTHGQALLVGTTLASGVLYLTDKYQEESNNGFLVKYKYYVALAVFVFGFAAVAIIRLVKH